MQELLLILNLQGNYQRPSDQQQHQLVFTTQFESLHQEHCNIPLVLAWRLHFWLKHEDIHSHWKAFLPAWTLFVHCLKHKLYSLLPHHETYASQNCLDNVLVRIFNRLQVLKSTIQSFGVPKLIQKILSDAPVCPLLDSQLIPVEQMCRVVLEQNYLVTHIKAVPTQKENYIRQIEVQILKVLLNQSISPDDC